MNYRGSIKFRFKQTYKPIKFYTKKFFGFITEITKSYNDRYEYNVGDKIGQLIIIPYPEINFVEVNNLSDTDRGEGGFGSTDKPLKVEKPKKVKKKK